MNLRILITGASGFVGQRLSVEAAKQGMAVRLAQRSPGNRSGDLDAVLVGDIDGTTNWERALQNVDVVIHLAARVHVMNETTADPLGEFRKTNVQGTENLARQAAHAGVRRLVYVSSIKVNGEETGEGHRYSEHDRAAPQDPYGVSKWEAEQVLHKVALETGLEVAIVRPPLVYGSGVKGNFLQMLKVLARHIPLPLAAAGNLRSMIYVENLVSALIACATHSAAAGQTYLVSDGEDVSTPNLLRILGSAMGHPARLIYCPESILRFAGLISGKSGQVERLLGSLRVDSGKIRRELNWAPRYTLQQGLQETAQWYRNEYL